MRGDVSSQASSEAGHRKRTERMEYQVSSLRRQHLGNNLDQAGARRGARKGASRGTHRAAMLSVRASTPGPLDLGFLVGLVMWPTAWPLSGDLMVAPLMPRPRPRPWVALALEAGFEARGGCTEPFASSMMRRDSAPG